VKRCHRCDVRFFELPVIWWPPQAIIYARWDHQGDMGIGPFCSRLCALATQAERDG
jgi:hypothetical protein